MPITAKKVVHTRQVPGYNFEIWAVQLQDGSTRFLPYFWKPNVPDDRIHEGSALRDELDTCESVPEAHEAGREIYLILTGKAKTLHEAGNPDTIVVGCAKCHAVGTTELPTDELVVKEGGKLLAGRSIRGVCGACGEETEFIPVDQIPHLKKLQEDRQKLRERIQGPDGSNL